MLMGKSKVSSKGWVVIPKEIREEMGIEAGDEVTFFFWPPLVRDKQRGFGTLRLMSSPKGASAGRGKYKGRPGDRPWTEDLLEDRRREVEQEEREIQRWRRKRKTSA
jgi:AbrB family looped-hinge helix DNA binding protein